MNEERHPRFTATLAGHQPALEQLLSEWRRGTLAHGWLISGAKGSGKASLAYHFARCLLAGVDARDMHENHPVFRRVAAGSHTDLLVVEPVFDEKKGERANEISVEQARGIAQFLSLTPAESAWRVVIVDSVDELNVNGANAILKTLEEPPRQSVILLTCHQPARLLPTIRSRCRPLRLKPLDKNDFSLVMRQIAPALEAGELAALGALSAYAPGLALMLHDAGALEVYEQCLALLSDVPRLDTAAVHSFSEQFGAGKVHGQWLWLSRLMLALLSRVCLQSSDRAPVPVSEQEGLILRTLASLHPAPVWAQKFQHASEQFLIAERLHLSYKEVLIVFLHSLITQEGFQLGILAA